MNILEAGAIKSTFFRRAFPKALEHFTYKKYRYCIADKFIVDDAIKFPVKMLMFDTNDASSFPDTHRESFDLLILKNHLHTHNDLDLAFTAYSEMVKPGGFILVEEQVERLPLLYPFESLVSPWICDGKAGPEGERILGCYYTESRWRAFFGRHGFQEIIHRADGMASAIFLLRKGVEVATPPCIMNVDDLQCSWLEDVKARYRDLQGQPEDARLWLVATEENSGIWGLVQSIRWESGSEKVRCVHVVNRNPGSKVPKLAADSAEFKELMKKDLVNNVYRDGRWGTYKTMVINEVSSHMRLSNPVSLSSIVQALASTVRCSRSSLWQVPTHWTLEEAATAPFAYATAFHALIVNARLRKGETVFVQSGWTPIGQAAITVALSHGCEVFTLTRNQDDVAALLASCPRLKEKHIYSNKDADF
ncbi:hypothetical protein RRG08_007167 [Elysia crispata]|uniref:Fatty acid synthase pseudo-KR domain-containing protein n=1 Tax=Elysia crispata TaxID=231223 RepID=A0AAE0YLA3_9GAST|nr:hypothetical protein RRG08_007167 [Elysia crispata]